MDKGFEKEVINRLAKIETKIDNIKKVEEDSTQALYLSKTNKEQIKEIKENQKWAWRTIAGIIIGYIINVVLSIKGGGQ